MANPPPNRTDATAEISRPAIERKTVNFDVKEIGDGDGNGSFSLYAAVFNNIDRSNEKILPNAFKNLPEFVQDGFLALNHDWKSLPLGLISEASQDNFGLKISGVFHGHQDAQDARRVLLERKAHGKQIKCSIGYSVGDDARVVENGKAFRALKSITIYEASIVSVPANDMAHVVDVKGMDAETPAPEAPRVCTCHAAADAPESPSPADLTPADDLPDTSRDAAATAKSFEDRTLSVVTAVGEFAAEVRKRAEIRIKAGRVLSGTNRDRIGAVLDSLKQLTTDLDALLAETAPKVEVDDETAEMEGKAGTPDAGTADDVNAQAEAEAQAQTLALRRRRTRLKIQTALLGIAS